jgi:hypothetical protein
MTSLALQFFTYGLGVLSGSSSATLPQPAITIGSTGTSIVIGLISRVVTWIGGQSLGQAVYSMSWLPTAVNLIGGWVILGLALLGLLSLFGKIITGVLVLVIIALVIILVFGIHIPISLPGLPTNSTLP